MSFIVLYAYLLFKSSAWWWYCMLLYNALMASLQFLVVFQGWLPLSWSQNVRPLLVPLPSSQLQLLPIQENTWTKFASQTCLCAQIIWDKIHSMMWSFIIPTISIMDGFSIPPIWSPKICYIISREVIILHNFCMLRCFGLLKQITISFMV